MEIFFWEPRRCELYCTKATSGTFAQLLIFLFWGNFGDQLALASKNESSRYTHFKAALAVKYSWESFWEDTNRLATVCLIFRAELGLACVRDGGLLPSFRESGPLLAKMDLHLVAFGSLEKLHS